jgi:uncharacterized membrane protein
MNSKPGAASAAAIALALGSALVQAQAHTMSADETAGKEKCFGVALKGQNLCASGPGTSCAGTSTVDHGGTDWLLVPKGSCTRLASPTSPTGFGQLKSFKAKARKA